MIVSWLNIVWAGITLWLEHSHSSCMHGRIILDVSIIIVAMLRTVLNDLHSWVFNKARLCCCRVSGQCVKERRWRVHRIWCLTCSLHNKRYSGKTCSHCGSADSCRLLPGLRFRKRGAESIATETEEEKHVSTSWQCDGKVGTSTHKHYSDERLCSFCWTDDCSPLG